MKKLIILLMLVLGMATKAFTFTGNGNELQNTKRPISELPNNWLFLLVILVLIGIFIWALYDWGWLKRNGFFKRKQKNKTSFTRRKKWGFEDLSFRKQIKKRYSH